MLVSLTFNCMAQWSEVFFTNWSPFFINTNGVHFLWVSTSNFFTLLAKLSDIMAKSSNDPLPLAGSYLVLTFLSLTRWTLPSSNHLSRRSVPKLFFSQVKEGLLKSPQTMTPAPDSIRSLALFSRILHTLLTSSGFPLSTSRYTAKM